MTRGWQVALVLGLLGLFTLFYQGLWGDPKMIPSVLIGTPAPTFDGPRVGSSERLGLEHFRGKVLVINFWASWCQECRLEHSNLLAIYTRFKDHPKFAMLGIDYQDKEDDALDYLREYGTSFPHIHDLTGALSIDYGVYGVPETFIIDQQGLIRYKWIGPIIGDAYTHVIEAVIPPLLNGGPAKT